VGEKLFVYLDVTFFFFGYFNFFSAEYPDFINQNFNDSFYAILEAQSTNGGRPTNISFDPDQNPIEVDNNYFQRRFHPIPNTGTGFDQNGSTGCPIVPSPKDCSR